MCLIDENKSIFECCQKTQIKISKKGDIITNYSENQNQICTLISGKADLIRYDQNGNKNIIESLYIADSYSCVSPKNIPTYFDTLKKMGYEKISFHSHNASGLALENSLKAIKCGAYIIDVCQNGIGGNLNFDDYKNCL